MIRGAALVLAMALPAVAEAQASRPDCALILTRFTEALTNADQAWQADDRAQMNYWARIGAYYSTMYDNLCREAN